MILTDNSTHYAARGRITRVLNGILVFAPIDTNYRLHLAQHSSEAAPSLDNRLRGIIRLPARKIWTVPSGGNYIAPIIGPPRTIQGRVRFLSDQTIVVHAGAPIIITLPDDDSAIDLSNGHISVGATVNVHSAAQATFELVE